MRPIYKHLRFDQEQFCRDADCELQSDAHELVSMPMPRIEGFEYHPQQFAFSVLCGSSLIVAAQPVDSASLAVEFYGLSIPKRAVCRHDYAAMRVAMTALRREIVANVMHPRNVLELEGRGLFTL